jgi:two-component system, NarL family, response regulator DegU
MRTRVIIADDHPIFRQGLVNVIQGTTQFELAGQAQDGKEALELIERTKPDIAVLDIAMPSMDGLEVIRTASQRALECEFVVLTMYREEEYFKAAMDLGVKGYLLKDGAAGDLLQCLRAVTAGKHYVSPAMSDHLILSSKRADGGPSLGGLSPTERHVLRLIAENKTSKEIADELHISFRTVQNHRAHICEKLKLEGYNRLLQFALEHKSLL